MTVVSYYGHIVVLKNSSCTQYIYFFLFSAVPYPEPTNFLKIRIRILPTLEKNFAYGSNSKKMKHIKILTI